jgi:hypothetical protein
MLEIYGKRKKIHGCIQVLDPSDVFKRGPYK